MRRRFALIRALLVLTGSGCATVGSVRQEPLNLGMLAYYAHPSDTTVAAVSRAFVDLKVTLKDSSQRDSATAMVIGTRGLSFFSYGEIVRAVVTGTAPNSAAVRILSRRRMQTNFLAADRAPSVLARMDAVLGGPTLGPGIRVRVWPADGLARPVVGTLSASSGGTLELEVDDRDERWSMPTADVRRVDVGRGSSHRGVLGATLGGLTGLVAGVLIGQRWGEDHCPPSSIFPCFDRTGTAFLGAAIFSSIGLVAGGVVGRLITSDRWVEAPWPRAELR